WQNKCQPAGGLERHDWRERDPDVCTREPLDRFAVRQHREIRPDATHLGEQAVLPPTASGFIDCERVHKFLSGRECGDRAWIVKLGFPNCNPNLTVSHSRSCVPKWDPVLSEPVATLASRAA